MKKSIGALKKLLAAMLCVCILSAVPVVTASAEEPEEFSYKSIDLINIILGSQVGDETQFMQMTMASSVSVFEKLGKAEDAAKLASSAGTWANLFKSAMGIIGPAGQVFTAINGSIIFMRTIGVIEDPTQTKLTSIKNTVNSIQHTVQEIDTKVDDLKTSISEQFADMKLEFQNQEYADYRALWTDFYRSDISEMNRLQNLYSDNLIKLVIGYETQWQKNNNGGLRSLYNSKGNQIYSYNNLDAAGNALPACPRKSDDSVNVSRSITLDGSYINGSIDKDIYVNADNYLEILNQAVKDGVYNAAQDGKLVAYDGFYDEWNSLSNNEKQLKAEKIAADLTDALMFEAGFSAANEGSFVTDVQNRFQEYCNFICENNNLVSPFNAQLKMLALTHGFEGEIKDDAAYLFTYFNNLTLDFGSFASMIMSLAQNKTNSERSAINSLWKNAQISTYNQLDRFITGNNNYCYILGSPIEYRDIQFQSQVSFTSNYPLNDPDDADSFYGHYTYEENAKVTKNWTMIDKSKNYNGISQEDIKKNEQELSSSMISSDDIVKLYGMYKGELKRSSTSSDDFLKYLVDNNAAVPKTANSASSPYTLNPRLVTKGYSYGNLDVQSGITMTNVKKCMSVCEYYFEEGKAVTLGSSLPGDEDCYVIHDRVKGDMFDMSSGKLSSGKNIVAKVFYGESNWYWFNDETWSLTTGKSVLTHQSKVQTIYDGNGEYRYFGNRTDYIDYYDDFSALVYTQPGTYTIPANVESIGGNLFGTGSGIKSLKFNGTPSSIDSEAFNGVGTENNRCFLSHPESWAAVSLAERWNGGYFADGYITLDADNENGDKITVPCASGQICMNIPCPFSKSSIPENMVFDGWSLTKGGAKITDNNVTAEDGMILYALWKYDSSLNSDKLLISLSQAVIDEDNGFVYGINPGEDNLQAYVSPAEGYTMRITPSGDKCGTGTVIEILSEGEIIRAYSVVVFGDMNGDSLCDSRDSVIVRALNSGMTWQQDMPAECYAAADCNHDMITNDTDAELMDKSGLGINCIVQKP